MTKIAIALLIAHGAAHAATPDVAAFLKQQHWQRYEARKSPAMPVDDLALVMYFAKGAHGPACGLLQAREPVFIDILSAGEGEDYPQCVSVDEVATFDKSGKHYLALAYTGRETRSESSRQFFFVYKDADGYVADDKLNRLTLPPKTDLAKAVRAAKAAR